MTDTIIVALISSAATLIAVYLKLKLDKGENKKVEKQTKILLEDLKAKRITLVLKEGDSDFDFTAESSDNQGKKNLFRFQIGESMSFLNIHFEDYVLMSKKDENKINKYTELLARAIF